jgi:TnpA family transposase
MSPRRSPFSPKAGASLGDDDVVRDWSLSPEDVAEVMRARGTEHRLRFAAQLCALRATGRFVSDYRQVPVEAVGYLARQLGLTPMLFLSAPERPATETAQAARICKYLGYHDFDATAEERL